MVKTGQAEMWTSEQLWGNVEKPTTHSIRENRKQQHNCFNNIWVLNANICQIELFACFDITSNDKDSIGKKEVNSLATKKF